MITSLIETSLILVILSHLQKNYRIIYRITIKLNLHLNLLVKSWTKIMMSQTVFQNILNLRNSIVGSFADIIKMATMFIKTTFRG